jgi:hypothetical protein
MATTITMTAKGRENRLCLSVGKGDGTGSRCKTRAGRRRLDVLQNRNADGVSECPVSQMRYG